MPHLCFWQRTGILVQASSGHLSIVPGARIAAKIGRQVESLVVDPLGHIGSSPILVHLSFLPSDFLPLLVGTRRPPRNPGSPLSLDFFRRLLRWFSFQSNQPLSPFLFSLPPQNQSTNLVELILSARICLLFNNNKISSTIVIVIAAIEPRKFPRLQIHRDWSWSSTHSLLLNRPLRASRGH